MIGPRYITIEDTFGSSCCILPAQAVHIHKCRPRTVRSVLLRGGRIISLATDRPKSPPARPAGATPGPRAGRHHSKPSAIQRLPQGAAAATGRLLADPHRHYDRRDGVPHPAGTLLTGSYCGPSADPPPAGRRGTASHNVPFVPLRANLRHASRVTPKRRRHVTLMA